MIDFKALTPDTLLRRSELAEALTAKGHRIAATTLANYATKGIGPLFSLEGKFAIYPWGSALAWAEARLDPLSPNSRRRKKKDEAARKAEAEELLADAGWPPEAA
jgi:hypothetical protein